MSSQQEEPQVVTATDQSPGADPDATPVPPEDTDKPVKKPLLGGRIGSVEILAAVLIGIFVLRLALGDALTGPKLSTGATIFVAICLQALPFLVFGVVLSAVISVFVPPSFFAKALPKRPVLAVPVAGVAGAALPACECASVPIAGALVRRGIAPAAAFAFLLASPAINPIVLVATAVAFPGQPMMVLARFVASLITAVGIGWLWLRLGKTDWIKQPARDHLDGLSKPQAFVASIRHDTVHAGGFLVLGALAAAVLKVAVPAEWMQLVADNWFLGILAMGLLAVLLSICSEADAFVAASLSQFSPTAKLAFLVVGPMVDIKLIAMQAGTFGRSFALRFAPVTFVAAILVSIVVGTVMFR